jgi:hypothetical protein
MASDWKPLACTKNICNKHTETLDRFILLLDSFYRFKLYSWNPALVPSCVVIESTGYRLNEWGSVPGSSRDLSVCCFVQTGSRFQWSAASSTHFTSGKVDGV